MLSSLMQVSKPAEAMCMLLCYAGYRCILFEDLTYQVFELASVTVWST